MAETTHFHPTFFYEAIWNLVGFALIMWLARKFQHKMRDGDVFLAYLIWYPLGRFWVEYFRPDAWLVGGSKLATAQLIALVSIVFGIVMLILRHRGWSPEAEVAVPEAVEPATLAEVEEAIAAAGDEIDRVEEVVEQHTGEGIES